MDRKSLPVLIMLAVAALLPISAGAAASAVAPSKSGVNELPGVENETSSTAPVLDPALVHGNGVAPASSAAAVSAEPAKPAFEFKTQEEARDKIRRAYLLQRNDELLRLSKAALAQWPDDASFDYYREIAENRIKAGNVDAGSEPAYKKLRDKRRKDAIRAILNESTGTAPVAGAAAGAARTPGARSAQAPPPAQSQAQQAVNQAKPSPRAAVAEPAPEPAPAPKSAMAKFKDQLLQPMAMYCLGGIVALGLIAVVLLRRKGSPAAKEESKDKIKLKAEKKAEKADKKKAEKAKAEPEKAEPVGTFTAAEELDSLFAPTVAAATGPAKATPEADKLDELFGSIMEPQTKASAPVPAPEPEPEPDFTHEETVPIMSGPIRLDDTPIELPSIDEVPPIETPISIPDLAVPEPVEVAAEPEVVAPISLSVPDEDPFYKQAPEPEPEPISLDASTSDLLTVAAEEMPVAMSDANAFFQPIMPEILEPPSIQPEAAATHGFGDDTTAALPPTEEEKTIVLTEDFEQTTISDPVAEDDETVSAEADLPTIDDEPAVSVHDDETVALDEERDLVEETAVSPEIPGTVESAANGNGGAGEDLFSRELQKGMSDFAGSNWAGAVHHLSIAAALKPGSSEVKDRLREARRRRKEADVK